jgi:hypothetical protein
VQYGDNCVSQEKCVERFEFMVLPSGRQSTIIYVLRQGADQSAYPGQPNN